MKSESLLDKILLLVEADKQTGHYLGGKFIYTIKVLDYGAYRLGSGEEAVLPGCRIGQLFHEEIYKSESEVLRNALSQIFKHSTKVALDFSVPGLRLEREEYSIDKN